MTLSLQRCALVRKEDIDRTLATAPTQGKKILEPLKSFAAEHGMPLNILEDNNTVNLAEVHKTAHDLWFCLEGEVTFVYGGELVEPRVYEKNGVPNEHELVAKEIRGGTSVVLTSGDWLWVPAGQPHQHSCKGTARLAIIKIPQASS